MIYSPALASIYLRNLYMFAASKLGYPTPEIYRPLPKILTDIKNNMQGYPSDKIKTLRYSPERIEKMLSKQAQLGLVKLAYSGPEDYENRNLAQYYYNKGATNEARSTAGGILGWLSGGAIGDAVARHKGVPIGFGKGKTIAPLAGRVLGGLFGANYLGHRS